MKLKEYMYPVMVLVSVMLVAWQQLGMNRSMLVFPGNPAEPRGIDDRISGGASVGTVTTDDGKISLGCETVRVNEIFPFCSVTIPIAANGMATDLSGYDSMDITLELLSDTRDTVLVYLLGDAGTSDDGKPVRKAMLRTIDPGLGTRTHTLQLDSFLVPSWWMFAFPGKDSAADLGKVLEVQISTGDAVHQRTETIVVQRIELKGKWIGLTELLTTIFTIWIVVAVAQSVILISNARKEASLARKRSRELEEINDLLSIEKEKYETMARTDPLTSALNRAGLRDSLDKIVHQFREERQPASVIIFDIDHFKVINDSFGHETGDEVLVKLVKLVQGSVRAADVLGRWGGEEFVLICPDTPIDRAVLLAEKLRKNIASAELLADQQISCSFGVSELRSTDIRDCFKLADEALYRAKQGGRNQVKID